ncbi:CHAT domain-containing protein [Marivirga atlantica]|jgi:CHAT domain-containing protein/Tfp pilus assembly protein PilF|uniref:CHAT domain-containing protein n=1 Tax=Marivirga atlantica TaxID=1548457 RepID=A0A937ABX0_9BACT|nr:CHAT domain-containing tetratricopeptide repeat protein [Marivirga atlantica]MBL0766106.1 CHAT domain-containing protein [Marivirga atlantica]
MRFTVFLLFIIFQGFSSLAQLSDSYKDYIKRSVRENPQTLIAEFDNKAEQDIATSLLIGELYFYSGNNDKAAEIIDAGLISLEASGEAKSSLYARALSNRGLIFWNDGKNEKAENYLERSLALNKQINATNEAIADTYNNLGLIAKSVDNLKQARSYFEQALELLESEAIPNEEKIALVNINLSLIEVENEKYRDALSRLNRLLSSWEKSHVEDLPTEAFILTNLALIYEQTGDPELARTFLKDAIDINRTFYGDRNAELANTYAFLAELERKQGNFKEALNNIQHALVSNSLNFNSKDYEHNPSKENVIKPSYQLSILLSKAQIFEDYYFNFSLKKQHLETALSCLDDADNIIDLIRANTSNKKDQLALSALASQVYESAQRIAITLDDVTLLGNTYLKKAFYYSEKAKASTLISAVAESDAKSFSNIPQSMLEEEVALKNRLAFLSNAIANAQDEVEISDYKKELFEAQRTYEQFIKGLEKDYPEYYNLKHNTAPSSLDEVQKSLEPNELLLSYAFAPVRNEIYRYEISQNDFKVTTIYYQEEVSRNLRAFRNILTYQIKQPYQPVASSLYSALIPKRIKNSITKITVIPDGILGTVPFEAFIAEQLEQNDFWALPYLIKEYAITYNYSASFHTIKPKATVSSKALLLAPVEFLSASLNSLPATREELNSLSATLSSNAIKCDTYIENRATENNFKTADLKNYKYIHLATHGAVNSTNPELSAIYLTGKDESDDGILYTNEIYDLNFNADLVSLSACETGLGKISRGEGIIGLGRAFSYAGAQHLLVSLWKVQDASTALLMQQFYKESVKKGSSFSKSLQQAQIELINNGYANPYLWAPFVIWGK